MSINYSDRQHINIIFEKTKEILIIIQAVFISSQGQRVTETELTVRFELVIMLKIQILLDGTPCCRLSSLPNIAFIFRVKQSKKTDWSYKWIHCYLSKRLKPHIERHSVTAKKNQIFSNIALRASHFPAFDGLDNKKRWLYRLIIIQNHYKTKPVTIYV